MEWFAYLAPLFAIYLIAISHLTQDYLRKTVATALNTDVTLKERVKYITNIALSWEAKLTFVNSMLAGLVAVWATFTSPSDVGWCIGISFLLLLLFVPGAWWIFSLKPDELTSSRFRKINLTYDKATAAALILVNILLIGAIYVHQLGSPPASRGQDAEKNTPRASSFAPLPAGKS